MERNAKKDVPMAYGIVSGNDKQGELRQKMCVEAFNVVGAKRHLA